MKDEIKISKDPNHPGWAVEFEDGNHMSVAQPRIETRGAVARLVIEMEVWKARHLADLLGGLPFYPAPLDVTEQLGHAVRELANAASEMSAAARALQPPTRVVMQVPVGVCENFQDHKGLGPHERNELCKGWVLTGTR
jgi:hypothetical protein